MQTATADSERIIDWLSKIRFCEGLEGDELTALANDVTVSPFAAGATLASAGDEVTEFWIVVEGEIECFLTDPRGREKFLGTVHAGETVGEISILEKSATRHVRFTARTHGTLLVAPAALLHVWIKTCPRIMQNLFFTLSERFKTVAGAGVRPLPSPRLGIVAESKARRFGSSSFATSTTRRKARPSDATRSGRTI